MYPHSYLDRCIRPLGYSFTRNVCTLLLPPTELLVQNQSTSPSGYQRGLWIYLGTHDLQILSPANVALQLTDKFFKGLMLSSLWAERHITSATWTFISSICYHVLFELWANPCNVGSRAKPLLAARFPPVQLWDTHLRHCQLPRVARTRLFVLPSLFMFLSMGQGSRGCCFRNPLDISSYLATGKARTKSHALGYYPGWQITNKITAKCT